MMRLMVINIVSRHSICVVILFIGFFIHILNEFCNFREEFLVE